MPKWKPTLFVAPSSDPNQPWWFEITFPFNADLHDAIRKYPGGHYAGEELGRKGVWRWPTELTAELKLLAADFDHDVVGLEES